MYSSFEISSMPSVPDRALVVNIFYKKGEFTTVALRKFRTEKDLKPQKKNHYVILKLVLRKQGFGRIVQGGRLSFVQRFQVLVKLGEERRFLSQQGVSLLVHWRLGVAMLVKQGEEHQWAVTVLLFWTLSFSKGLSCIRHGTLYSVQSLQHGILHFCATTLCLNCRKYMLLPSYRMLPIATVTSDFACCHLQAECLLPQPTLDIISGRFCWTLSPKSKKS